MEQNKCSSPQPSSDEDEDLLSLCDMAAMKRQFDKDDPDIPAEKRQAGRTKLPTQRPTNGPPLKINPEVQLKLKIAASSHHTKPINDSSEKGKISLPAASKVFTNSLPFESYPSGFPCFDNGSVYIIIDPQNRSYQYRLNRSVLMTMSTRFATVLSTPLHQEASMALKIAKASAGARRFELVYSTRFSTWILRQTPFTTLEKPGMSTTSSSSHCKTTSNVSSQSKSGPIVTLTAETMPNSLHDSIVAGKPSIQVNPNRRLNVAENKGSTGTAKNYEEAQKTVNQQPCLTQTNDRATMNSGLLHEIPAEEQRALSNQFDRDFASETCLSDRTNATQWNLSGINRSGSNESLDELVSVENHDEFIRVAAVQEAAASGDLRRPSVAVCKAYDNLFRLFYNKIPLISTWSLEIALQQSELVIEIATRLGAIPAIQPQLGNHFGIFGRDLYLGIASQPLRWLSISLKTESPTIFREVMVHLVGKHVPIPKVRGIPDIVHQIFQMKESYLAWKKSDVNERILLCDLDRGSQNETVTGAIKIDTVSWHLTQLFRDFCCREIRLGYTSEKDANFYRTLSVSGDSFMPINEALDTLTRLCGTEKINAQDVEKDLMTLKNYGKAMASELLVNESMLNLNEVDIDYLTCTRIEDDELPWKFTQVSAPHDKSTKSGPQPVKNAIPAPGIP